MIHVLRMYDAIKPKQPTHQLESIRPLTYMRFLKHIDFFPSYYSD